MHSLSVLPIRSGSWYKLPDILRLFDALEKRVRVALQGQNRIGEAGLSCIPVATRLHLRLGRRFAPVSAETLGDGCTIISIHMIFTYFAGLSLLLPGCTTQGDLLDFRQVVLFHHIHV